MPQPCQVAEEQGRFDAKVSWLAALPQVACCHLYFNIVVKLARHSNAKPSSTERYFQLQKKYKKAVAQHNQLLEDPETLTRWLNLI